MFILLQRIGRRRAGFPQILLQEDFRHFRSSFAPLHARQYHGTCPRSNPQPNDADRSAGELDAVNFWEQVLFSWLTGNADMHLKNFSLYSRNPGVYGLTPAYDLLSTGLVLPEDTEELALTLNGRKRKLRRNDFVQAMTASGMDEKVIDNLFKKFIKAIPKWGEWIDVSFLPEEMKGKYKALIAERIKQLK